MRSVSEGFGAYLPLSYKVNLSVLFCIDLYFSILNKIKEGCGSFGGFNLNACDIETVKVSKVDIVA